MPLFSMSQAVQMRELPVFSVVIMYSVRGSLVGPRPRHSPQPVTWIKTSAVVPRRAIDRAAALERGAQKTLTTGSGNPSVQQRGWTSRAGVFDEDQEGAAGGFEVGIPADSCTA